MDKTYFTKAIILKREPFRERDSRVLAYSLDFGLLELVARGTRSLRSKLAGHLEPFNQIDAMVIKGRQWDYLGAAAARRVFRGLKEDSAKTLLAGQLCCSLVRLIKPGISDETIYGLILEYLAKSNDPKLKASSEYLSAIALLKILSRLGYQPMLNGCAACGQTPIGGKVVFSPEKGGLVCGSCRDAGYAFPLSPEALRALAAHPKLSLSEISKIKTDKSLESECVKAINAFYRYHF